MAVWIVLLAVAYAAVAWVLRRRGALCVRHFVAFAAGLACLAVALSSPLERAAATALSAHMAQHVLLVAAAGPLLAYALPLARMTVVLPLPLRRAVRAAHRWSRGSLAVVAVLAATALGLHVAVVWAWHLPPLYEAALRSPALHGLEHMTMLASAMALWWVLLGFGARTAPSAAPIAMLLALGVQGAALGALMAFAARPWYATYADAGVGWAGSPLADQQLAGLLMWGVGGVAAVVAAAVLVVGWLDRLDRYPRRMAPRREKDRGYSV